MASGAMISSGLFVLPAVAYKYSGPSLILSYLVAGLLLIPTIFSKSELLTAMPKTGGTYFFIERIFGPVSGIFGGFSNWFSISLKSTFALIGIGAFVEYSFPEMSYYHIKLVAAAFCVFFVLINLLSVRVSAHLNNYMVVFLLIVCFVYIFVGGVYLGIRNTPFTNFTPFMHNGWKGMLSVAGMVFISYGGLTKVTSIAEETNNPSRTIPRGMFLSFFVVQVIYVFCVAVTIGLLPPYELINTLTPLTHGGLQIGMVFGILMSLAAMVAFFTTANAGILSSSRVPLAMAKDDLLPDVFANVSKKRKIPYFSIVITGAFMLSLILFLNLETLVKAASTLMIILFMFMNLSVIVMRESKIINYRPTFMSPLYPWIQIIAIITYGFLIFAMDRIPLIISVYFVAMSILWYFLYVRKKISRDYALMHLVERVTAKEFVDISLEEELKEILHKRDNIIKDRFDHLIESCAVLDIEEEMTRDEFFSAVSEILPPQIGVDKKEISRLLGKREQESTTVLEQGLAIPHIVVEGEGKFEIVLVRSKKGIIFSPDKEPVHIIFVLAGSMDERNFHLRALMAIANIVR